MYSSTMEVQKYSDWKDEVEENPEGLMFDIACRKCKSKDILLCNANNVGMGSEYTGMYGEADAVIKCKACGNAFSWEVWSA